MALFDSIHNSIYFVEASTILFLNKRDLFREKLVITPLTVAFKSYTGILKLSVVNSCAMPTFSCLRFTRLQRMHTVRA